MLAVLAVGTGAPADADARGARPVSHGVDAAPLAIPPRARPASLWCGDPQALARPRADAPHRFQAVYALPADAGDRFAQTAPVIEADALAASGRLERAYGRAIRFRMASSCGARRLAITTIRLPQTRAELARAGGGPALLDLIVDGLERGGYPLLRAGDARDRAATLADNFVVWLDAPVDAGCGVSQTYRDDTRRSTNWNNYGGKVSLLLRSGRGFCGPSTVLHELGHALGAVQPGAPHATADGHCDDAFEDVMCSGGPLRAGGAFESTFFDYGNDDYWDPPQGGPLPWWTVNLSRFVCEDRSCNRAGAGLSRRSSRSATPAAAARRRSRRCRAGSRRACRSRARRGS